MDSLHILWPQDRKIPCAYPKGFRKVHVGAPTGSCGFHTRLGIRLCMRAPCGCHKRAWGISLWSVVPGRTGSDESHEVTFMLYLPSKTCLCAIWPVGASTAPARRSTSLLLAHIRRKTCMRSRCPYGSKHLRNILRAYIACRVITHGAPNCPEAACRHLSAKSQ